MIIDPRAGHGPGIGGFKDDSEVGVALRTAIPATSSSSSRTRSRARRCSVCEAENAFVRKVRELHPDARGQPFVIGNCQGGWALMMLAALAPRRHRARS